MVGLGTSVRWTMCAVSCTALHQHPASMPHRRARRQSAPYVPRPSWNAAALKCPA